MTTMDYVRLWIGRFHWHHELMISNNWCLFLQELSLRERWQPQFFGLSINGTAMKSISQQILRVMAKYMASWQIADIKVSAGILLSFPKQSSLCRGSGSLVKDSLKVSGHTPPKSHAYFCRQAADLVTPTLISPTPNTRSHHFHPQKHICFDTLCLQDPLGPLRPPNAPQMSPRCHPDASQMPLRCLPDASQMQGPSRWLENSLFGVARWGHIFLWSMSGRWALFFSKPSCCIQFVHCLHTFSLLQNPLTADPKFVTNKKIYLYMHKYQ